MSNHKRVAPGNKLLAALGAPDRRLLMDNAESIDLVHAQRLQEPGEPIRQVYFPIDSLVCLLTPGTTRAQLEIGLVGNEGMTGATLLLGVDESPLCAMVQGAGRTWRVSAAAFLECAGRSSTLRAALDRYLHTQISQLVQTVACARFHRLEARLARWLMMTRDRTHSNKSRLTHEFLAMVLGVRRVGVTGAAGALQRRNLIRYNRGDIQVLDVGGLRNAACECYSADRKSFQRVFAPEVSGEPVSQPLAAAGDPGAAKQLFV